MGLSGVYNDPVQEEVGISIIMYAFSKGITFFDSADVYGANANEVLVGKMHLHNNILLDDLYSFILATMRLNFEYLC